MGRLLTTLLLVRVVSAVVHLVAHLVRAQAHAVVAATERPGGRARVFGWGEKAMP